MFFLNIFFYNFPFQNINLLKRIIAILLLGCFTLYHFGYYVFYFSMKIQIESNWSDEVFSENPNNQDHSVLDIPLTLPYMADQEEFQVTNTSFEKDGKFFRVIKQKYAKDTLQLVYVPDTAKRILDKTMKQWISSLIHDKVPDGSGNTLLTKTFVKDYTQPKNPYDFALLTLVEKKYSCFPFLILEDQPTNLDSPPPESA